MPAPESADDDTGAATTTGPGTAAAADGFTSLVKVATGGDRRPLFVVHGAGGNVLFLWGLAKALSAERSVYAFQARGIDRRLPPDMSIGEMANRYVGELLAAHEGPFVLGGYSGGGIIALEMVKLLQAAGHDVLDVLLFDSVPPGCAEPAKRDRRRNLVANARRHGVASIGPFLAEHYAWRFRRGGTAPHHAEELADWESEDTVDMFPYFSWIAERHTMTSYDVDATVFKADRVWPIQPDDYYWSPYVTGRLDFRNVPGDHRSMFFPENIPALAAAVEPVLRRTDEAVPYVPAVGGSGAAAAG